MSNSDAQSEQEKREMADWQASIPGFGVPIVNLEAICFPSPQTIVGDQPAGEPRLTLKRVPTEIWIPPPDSPSQPEAESMLIKYGIKVRDFGYSSELPPVPIVKRKPRPTKLPTAGERGLKRTRRESNEDGARYKERPRFSINAAAENLPRSPTPQRRKISSVADHLPFTPIHSFTSPSSHHANVNTSGVPNYYLKSHSDFQGRSNGNDLTPAK
ncbi:hypothetical protein BD410DRAFT_841058 [Rickenella mellea]|uniref:Uncharacterized protein n=1 Tax=Rickenella mellea TaxID=50990 RepID=A0A4Y7Q247_9AGAM|nr:hypothetical protein BD410DRAFT_841058 [Rickenella mellea]